MMRPRKNKKRIDPRYFLVEQGRLDEVSNPEIARRINGVVLALAGPDGLLARIVADGFLSAPEAAAVAGARLGGREAELPRKEIGTALEEDLTTYAAALNEKAAITLGRGGDRRGDGSPADQNIENLPRCPEASVEACNLVRVAVGYLDYLSGNRRSDEAIWLDEAGLLEETEKITHKLNNVLTQLVGREDVPRFPSIVTRAPNI